MKQAKQRHSSIKAVSKHPQIHLSHGVKDQPQSSNIETSVDRPQIPTSNDAQEETQTSLPAAVPANPEAQAQAQPQPHDDSDEWIEDYKKWGAQSKAVKGMVPPDPWPGLISKRKRTEARAADTAQADDEAGSSSGKRMLYLVQ